MVQMLICLDLIFNGNIQFKSARFLNIRQHLYCIMFFLHEDHQLICLQYIVYLYIQTKKYILMAGFTISPFTVLPGLNLPSWSSDPRHRELICQVVYG